MTTTSFNHFENGTDALDIYHWFLCVTGEKDRNYFLTIIPDLYFIQFNMKTKHFANRIDYLRDSGDGPKPVYQGEEVKVHAMSDEELEEIDKKIGYLKSYVEKEDGTLVTEYDNIFVDYLRKYIRTNQYVVDLGYEMPFYNEVTTYKVKDDMNIYDYLNNGYRNQDDLDKWFKLLTDKIDERFEDNPAKYRECIGKVNGLKKCIKTNNARKFRVLMGILASDFVPEKWQVDENNYCSTEYLTKKMEFLFPRLFSCNEEFPPLTARFTGLAVAFIQGFFYPMMFLGTAEEPMLYFRVALILTAGTAFLLWLGDQITDKGIGNGVSLLIMAGIVNTLPSMFITVFKSLVPAASNELIGWLTFGSFILLYLGIIVGVIYIEQAERRIPIQYSNRSASSYGGQQTFLPFKLNSAGVMPVIIASVIMGVPSIISYFTENAALKTFLTNDLSTGKPLGFVIYVVLIILFTYI